jgi:hypothetical protein
VPGVSTAPVYTDRGASPAYRALAALIDAYLELGEAERWFADALVTLYGLDEDDGEEAEAA